MYYERSGAGEPLLFITGFTITGAVFEPILPLYERSFGCITYDNRASGRSDAPRRLTSMPEVAADARRLLDTLDIGSAHVYGVSMGGMIAQELAIRFPERVRGLILGGTWPGGPRAVRPALRDLAGVGAASARALREPGRPYLATALFSAEFRRGQPERVRELLEPFRRYRAPPKGCWRNGGPRSTTTLFLASASSGPPRWSCTASSTPSRRWPTRGC
jgi:3-oxoadipate enol-lactonase